MSCPQKLDGRIVFLRLQGKKLLTDRFFSVRAQKALGLVNGTPDYTEVSGFVVPDVPARIQSYSSDGRLYAYALPAV